LSTGVASSAVGVEDLFSVVNVCGKSGLDSKSESNGTSGDSLQRNQNHHCKSDVNKIERYVNQTNRKHLQSDMRVRHA
jgi:hypothetical protein